jgi:Reprolysin family propeptide
MLLRFRPLPSSHVLATIFLVICFTTFTSGRGHPSNRFLLLIFSLFRSADFRRVLPASRAQRPLKRIHHPTTLAIEIYPRTQHLSSSHHARDIAPDSTTLHHTDSFRLTLSAFGETYHLHLRPNDHLVHPSARIVYYDTNLAGQSVVSHTEPLLLSSVRAYWGEVVPAQVSSERMRADAARAPHHPGDVIGWARITVHDQGDAQTGRPPVFEGAFSVRGVTHHVTMRDNYFRNRGPLDPHLHPRSSAAQHSLSEADSGLVIWRDSDIMDPSEERAARRDYAREQRGSWTPDEPDLEPARCAIDTLPWNSDPLSNPVLRRPSSTSSWYGALGLGGVGSLGELLKKRDDIAGPGMNTK